MRAERMSFLVLMLSMLAVGLARGDDILYRYEGDVPLLDPSTGWIVANPCSGSCTQVTAEGRHSFHWEAADIVNNHLWISQAPEQPPSTLWVEWRFRSDDLIGGTCFGDDAWFALMFRQITDVILLHGNAAINFSGDFGIVGLDPSQFHSHRFESANGRSFRFSVDGHVYWSSVGVGGSGASYLQLGGIGGCTRPTTDEWDFVRYGTLGGGERVVATDPPEGVLDARVHAFTDRFLATFDTPSYVYVDDIDAAVVDPLGGGVRPELAPSVLKTWRREPPDPFDVEDDPRIVEIVLDRPIPFNATTHFTLSDGVTSNAVEYTFALGDANGTGAVDLADIAHLQSCAGSNDTAGICGVFDFNRDGAVGVDEFLDALSIIVDPAP